MKKIASIEIIILLLILAIAHSVLAGPRYEQTASSTAGSATLTIESSDSVNPAKYNGVDIEWIIIDATASTTSTVQYVTGGVTNQLGTKAVTATDKALAATNLPTLEHGDLIRITGDTNSHNIVVVGTEIE
jgi:hypothetical protein